MSATTPLRIDAPGAAVPARAGQIVPGGQIVAGSGRRSRTANGDRSIATTPRRTDGQDRRSRPVQPISDGPTQDEWLRLHAVDLINRLQEWACDLDAREAQLNSRTSIQEHRERRFRLRQQVMATELSEQQRSVERIRRELEAKARWLAFQHAAG